ncbi:hypothetical protein D9M69_610930 [compost metagenome]
MKRRRASACSRLRPIWWLIAPTSGSTSAGTPSLSIGVRSCGGRASTSWRSRARGRMAQAMARPNRVLATATSRKSRATDCSTRERRKSVRASSVSATWITTRCGPGWPASGADNSRA